MVHLKWISMIYPRIGTGCDNLSVNIIKQVTFLVSAFCCHRDTAQLRSVHIRVAALF